MARAGRLGLLGVGSGRGYGIPFREILFRQFGGGAGLDDTDAAVALCLLESVVGELEEQVNAIGGFIESGDANGYGYPVGGPLAWMGTAFPEWPGFRWVRRWR
jgi:hypothetical protein